MMKSFYQAFGITLGVATGAVVISAVSGTCLGIYALGVYLLDRPSREDRAA